VWTAIASFDPRRGALRTWLVTIARNKAIDYLRSPSAQLNRMGCELDGDAVPKPTAGGLMDDELMRICATRLINEAMRHLTVRQQEVIHLAYFEGQTQADIANSLQAPLGSVKSWVRGGLKKLRESLPQQSARLAY
jgi:RNA polymerase sigma-70 factor (ECF subfamily)